MRRLRNRSSVSVSITALKISLFALEVSIDGTPSLVGGGGDIIHGGVLHPFLAKRERATSMNLSRVFFTIALTSIT